VFGTEVFFEFVIELFDRLVECPLDRILIAYEGGVLQGMPEVPDPVFAVLVFDEVKEGMAKIIIRWPREWITRGQMATSNKFRNAIAQCGVSDDQCGPWGPILRVVFAEAFEYPSRRSREGIEHATRRSPKEVILENMADFVFDEVVDFVDGHISLDSNSVQKRLCHPEDSFWDLAQVGLIKICGGGVVEKRDGSG